MLHAVADQSASLPFTTTVPILRKIALLRNCSNSRQDFSQICEVKEHSQSLRTRPVLPTFHSYCDILQLALVLSWHRMLDFKTLSTQRLKKFSEMIRSDLRIGKLETDTFAANC